LIRQSYVGSVTQVTLLDHEVSNDRQARRREF
jgi:hypothetical protein